MLEIPPSMSSADFARLIEREHERLELKTGAGRKPLQEVLVAFTNTSGGVILVGVRGDRTLVGRRRDQGLDDDVHGAARDARQIGRYDIREISVDGRPIVAITVHPRVDEVAQTSDGRVLVRQGGHNLALFGRDLLALMASRSLVRFESTDSGVPITAVNQAVSHDVAVNFAWSDPATQTDRWRERGLLHDSGNLTIVGALVLTNPARTLAAAKFHVDVRVYEQDDGTSYVFRRSLEGPVQRQVEQTSDLINERIGTEMVITGTRRHDVARLPARVVREAIANAVAHRSYELDVSPVVVEIRPTRVVIISPGRLPAPVTVETLRQSQAPRNHTVIAVLRRFGLAEDSGQGIDVMQDAMRLELLQEPTFVEDAEAFRVELSLTGLVSATERAWLQEYERTQRTRPQERSLLLAVLREGQVTNSRAREVLGVDSTEARTRLQRLRDTGLLVQHGTRGRAYYTLGSFGPGRTEQQIVLEAASSEPLTNQRVRELTGMDRVAARTLLSRLVREGNLDQHGDRRGTTYTLPRT